MAENKRLLTDKELQDVADGTEYTTFCRKWGELMDWMKHLIRACVQAQDAKTFHSAFQEGKKVGRQEVVEQVERIIQPDSQTIDVPYSPLADVPFRGQTLIFCMTKEDWEALKQEVNK